MRKFFTPILPKRVDKGSKVGTEEHLIRFRPSPNFKNMKKFIKSKIDFTESSNQSPPTNTSPEPITSLEEQKALLEKAKPAQPPVHLETPPSLPIDFSLPYKQEYDDQALYNTENVASKDDSENTEPNPDKPKKVICRDYIRGTCSRAGSCKYAHERDLSQLVGVYTFCNNFQNRVCTYPYCKYVHATIFEEQRFYRTGELPPHTLAHLKKPPPVPAPVTPVLPPPPPPPPEEQVPPPMPVVPVELPFFAQPPPQLVPSVENAVIACVPAANFETRALNDFITAPPPRDIDIAAKKCKSCDTMDFRLQFNKDKCENMSQSAMALKSKIDRLAKKSHTLYNLLMSLMKPHLQELSKQQLNGTSLSSILNRMGDSERNLLSSLLRKEPSEQNMVSEARNS